ncbi:MAG: linear amide C-N hydrolase [Clostridia bacterium]|nr:linear amide C-N hydrolase [Clostridia bacterium]NCC44782.1 linear amide C-N hydrolase [Clostridia bacterium]
MDKKIFSIGMMLIAVHLTGCSNGESVVSESAEFSQEDSYITDSMEVNPTDEIVELEDGLSVVRFEGIDGFSQFLENGGASSDSEVVQYISSSMLDGAGNLIFQGNPFGCSTIAAQNEESEYLFGRNFDWYNCDALIVEAYPDDEYASISTVNTDFIKQGAGAASALFSVDNIMTIAALYAPIDGMNEKGLAVSVNMIQDQATIEQTSELPDITTTTAVRLLLNQAATVDEAVELLKLYDLHASFGFMIHFAISDANGEHAVIEYVDQEMIVTKTPVVTNFYMAEGDKYGIGTSQSMERYDILIQMLDDTPIMSELQIRDALESVSKHHYQDGETTEWSAVFNQTKGEAIYYHREDFTKSYHMSLERVDVE